LIAPEEIDYITSELKSSELIITQPINDGYRGMPIGTNQLRETCNSKTKIIVIPNLYFEGYHPNFLYIKDQNNQTVSPRLSEYKIFKSDYHDAFCFSAKILGLNFADYINIYEKIVLDESWINTNLTNSLDALRKRESECDIKISRHIEDNFLKTQLFWTFNHPSNNLLEFLTDKIIELLGLSSISKIEFPELLTSEIFPIMSSTAKILSLDFKAAPAKLGGNTYHDYSSSCYQGYEKLPELAKFNLTNKKIMQCIKILEEAI
jgi:hypothetical protein